MTIRMQVSPGDDRAALARVACPITVPAVSTSRHASVLLPR
jgi:hypothetical protein